MTDPLSFESALAAAAPHIKKNFALLRAHHPECLFGYVMLAIAKHGDTVTTYTNYLTTESQPVKAALAKRMPPNHARNRLLALLNTNKKPAIKNDKNEWDTIVYNAIAADTGMSLSTLLQKNLTKEDNKDYGVPPEKLYWTHADAKAALAVLAEEKPGAEKHFYELKKKFPDSLSDWALLLLARHTTSPISPSPRLNSGTSDTLRYFAQRGAEFSTLGRQLQTIMDGSFFKFFNTDARGLALVAFEFERTVPQIIDFGQGRARIRPEHKFMDTHGNPGRPGVHSMRSQLLLTTPPKKKDI